jgi:hypothetical protein
MNINKTILSFLLVAITSLIYFACDDSGITTISQNTNFSSYNLKFLPPSDSAFYELFVNFDSTGSKFCSMGKFNMNISSQPVNLSGTSMEFKFDFTPDLSKAKDAFISLEPVNDLDTMPNGPVIVGAQPTYVNGVLTYNMNMSYSRSLGNVATQFASDSARYIFATPTNGFQLSTYNRGIWFTTDPFGNNAGITCQSLNSTNWKYHAYVIDIRDSSHIYNVGAFADPSAGDDYHLCLGTTGSELPKPGNDWLQTSCPGNGWPDIDSTVQNNLNSGNFRAMITIEPRNRPAGSTSPYFIRLFFGDIGMPGGFTYNRVPNVSAGFLPTATIQVQNKSGQ